MIHPLTTLHTTAYSLRRVPFYEGNAEMKMQIVNPVGRRSTAEKLLAPRLASLEGATVGLLDNNKPGAKEIFDGLVPRLRDLGVSDVIYRRKVHPAGPSPYVVEVADSVDVAISALGD